MINVPFYFLYFLCYAGILALLVIHDSSEGEAGEDILMSQGLLSVLIALSLGIGFICLVCLLGYSLVKIPIHYWIDSDYEEKLNRLLFKIARYDEQSND